MEEKLLRQLKETRNDWLCGMAILLAIATVLLVLTLCSNPSVLNGSEQKNNDALFQLWIALLFEAGALLGMLSVTVVFFLEQRTVRKRQYQIIEGLVLRFARVTNGTNPITHDSVPVIEDQKSGRVLSIRLDRAVEIGETYLINYLPRTGVAVVVSRASVEKQTI